ncbi:hypothetical protein [Klebsiella pneumoniae]|uniref:hypothetical protein n=1 Tax=Klebsiella pneumoniae TaxID=573 RepID=UPI00215301BC|nr:hypothetical protein [Klebsiella pneumoniae]
MVAVINFEYLISPALYEPDFFNKIAGNIRLLSELFSAGIPIAFIEEDIVIKMQSNGFFPSEKVYQRIISQLEEPSIGASDIVRMVNTILSRSQEFDASYITHVVEWDGDVAIEPNFHSISDARFNELKEFYANLSIENTFSSKEYTSLYFNPKEPMSVQKINLSGGISSIYPEKDKIYPCEYNSDIDLLSDVDSLFLRMDGYDLFKSAKTPLEMKLSIYAGTLRLIKTNNLDTCFSWDDFKVGSGFINSLNENECYADQQFSSNVYDVLINLLAKTDKADVDYFYRSDSSREPRTLGHLTAYRVHITKKVRALRLLFWSDGSNGKIILANVGNKSELEILAP